MYEIGLITIDSERTRMWRDSGRKSKRNQTLPFSRLDYRIWAAPIGYQNSNECVLNQPESDLLALRPRKMEAKCFQFFSFEVSSLQICSQKCK